MAEVTGVDLYNVSLTGNKTKCLNSIATDCDHVPEVIIPVYVLATSCYDAPITDGDISHTLCARAGTGGNQLPLMLLEKIKDGKRKYLFRRVTPTECARLQGFPDWWCDNTNASDTAMYKMWGNGIALPCAADVIGRLAKELEK